HPTYKALAEVGKAEKTIFLCDYLPSLEIQREVHEGLNVVENWNATNDFICYGRQGELATNSREQQEIVTLSLQLLQNCMMLINTILLERTIEREGLWDKLSVEDRRALSPLFSQNPPSWRPFDGTTNNPQANGEEAGTGTTRRATRLQLLKKSFPAHPRLVGSETRKSAKTASTSADGSRAGSLLRNGVAGT